MWCTCMINHFWTTVGPMILGLSVCPSVHLLRAFFFLDNCSKDFSDFVYGYGALWVWWSDRALFQDKFQIWPIMAENGHKKPKITLVEMISYHSMETTCPGKFWFSSYGLKNSRPIRSLDYFFILWQRTTLRNFLKFYMIVEMILHHHVQIACRGKFWFLSYDPKSRWSIRLLGYFFGLWQRTTHCKEFSEFLYDSGDDSLPLHANCMFRKIVVLELWPKKLLANQIARLLFQILTKNCCKEFSEFLHDDSGDDSLPSTYKLHAQENSGSTVMVQ